MPKVRSKRQQVELVDRTYQPTQQDFMRDIRVNADFEATVRALVQPVEIKKVAKPSP
ncbi:MAG: hypothetical protein OXP73_09085 [Chloroflexota bacterium]|nr:hypothetical protein [Chloroflexota bacterium]